MTRSGNMSLKHMTVVFKQDRITFRNLLLLLEASSWTIAGQNGKNQASRPGFISPKAGFTGFGCRLIKETPGPSSAKRNWKIFMVKKHKTHIYREKLKAQYATTTEI
ncbi:hypothetical protein CHARACLAT_018803 [Characodon lateralis]|uniref:Uncharacterized protein n=1 Tax=Characodon lateralis TaxID=208331 RepID=A0ABU7F6N7_9TELE|nr:hypothetical protein [Characodon lateralis]